MKIYKEKASLIFDFEDGRKCSYNFATKESIGIKGKPVGKLCEQLRGLSVENLLEYCNDKKYAKFLSFVQKQEPFPIENIGTILDRVPKYQNYEQLFSAGIDDILCNNCNFKYKINDIPKALIKLCKNHTIKLSNNIVEYYKKDHNEIILGYNMKYMSLTDKDIYELWTTDNYTYDRNTYRTNYYTYFNLLLHEYDYTAKALFLYVDQIKTLEAIESMDFLIRELYDYAKMMKTISNKFDKYPRHFLTTHKIACRNYNRLKAEFDEKKFVEKINVKMECIIDDFVFIYPKSTQDIKDEAVSQNNCVASYINKVINGECDILFMRNKSTPNSSLVTIEVKNGIIVQALRRFNDSCTKKQNEAVEKWNIRYSKIKKEGIKND